MPGLRDSAVGTDTLYYVNMFQKDLTYTEWFEQGIEFGFVTILKVFKALGVENYWIFLTGFSFLFNYLVISAIYKIRIGVLISLVSFFTFSFIYILQFNVLRQALALAFFIHSIPYILKEENKKAYFFIFMAFLFHVSAIVLFIMPYLRKKLKENIIYYCLISTVLIFLYAFFSKYVVGYVAAFTGATRYENYLDRVDGGNFGLSILFLIYCGLMVVALLFLNFTKLKDDADFKFFFFLLFVSVVLNFSILFLGLPYEGIGRVILYFTTSYIFIFSYMINQFKSDIYIFVSFLTCLIMMLFFAVIFNYAKFHGVFPYSFNIYLN